MAELIYKASLAILLTTAAALNCNTGFKTAFQAKDIDTISFELWNSRECTDDNNKNNVCLSFKASGINSNYSKG